MSLILKHQEVLQHLGLARNEAKIYETLLRDGELTISLIARRSQVNRRNVYDSLQRLSERGLVFEILEKAEKYYHAVDPHKLNDILGEKQEILNKSMPNLEKLHRNLTPHQEQYVYRGIEGWKNYMRDILRVGEDFYCLGGKGAWMDKRLDAFYPKFINELRRKKITCYHLFDHEVQKNNHPILKEVGTEYKILPPQYSTNSSIGCFGSYLILASNIQLGRVESTEFTFTVLVNSHMADSFRTWFRLIWESSWEDGKRKKKGDAHNHST